MPTPVPLTLVSSVAAVSGFIEPYQILIVAGVILAAAAALLKRLTRVGR